MIPDALTAAEAWLQRAERERAESVAVTCGCGCGLLLKEVWRSHAEARLQREDWSAQDIRNGRGMPVAESVAEQVFFGESLMPDIGRIRSLLRAPFPARALSDRPWSIAALVE